MVRKIYYACLITILIVLTTISIFRVHENREFIKRYEISLNEVGLDRNGNVIDQEKFIKAIKESRAVNNE